MTTATQQTFTLKLTRGDVRDLLLAMEAGQGGSMELWDTLKGLLESTPIEGGVHLPTLAEWAQQGVAQIDLASGGENLHTLNSRLYDLIRLGRSPLDPWLVHETTRAKAQETYRLAQELGVKTELDQKVQEMLGL